MSHREEMRGVGECLMADEINGFCQCPILRISVRSRSGHGRSAKINPQLGASRLILTNKGHSNKLNVENTYEFLKKG